MLPYHYENLGIFPLKYVHMFRFLHIYNQKRHTELHPAFYSPNLIRSVSPCCTVYITIIFITVQSTQGVSGHVIGPLSLNTGVFLGFYY